MEIRGTKKGFIDLFNRSLETKEDSCAMIGILHENGAEIATMGDSHTVMFAMATYFESMIRRGELDREDVFFALADMIDLIDEMKSEDKEDSVDELV